MRTIFAVGAAVMLLFAAGTIHASESTEDLIAVGAVVGTDHALLETDPIAESENDTTMEAEAGVVEGPAVTEDICADRVGAQAERVAVLEARVKRERIRRFRTLVMQLEQRRESCELAQFGYQEFLDMCSVHSDIHIAPWFRSQGLLKEYCGDAAASGRETPRECRARICDNPPPEPMSCGELDAMLEATRAILEGLGAS